MSDTLKFELPIAVEIVAEEVKQMVAAKYRPEDVFPEDVLVEWAGQHNYIMKQEA